MARYSSYTREFKESIVQKFLANPEITVTEISEESGVPESTVRSWRDKYNLSRGFTVTKPKSNILKAEEKFNIVVLTSSMSEAEKSEYCRKHGIYPEEIAQWTKDCISGCDNKSGSASAKKNLKKERDLELETKRLRKEIRRKDKALAETAALLVLKKKAQEIWGDQEDEE